MELNTFWTVYLDNNAFDAKLGKNFIELNPHTKILEEKYLESNTQSKIGSILDKFYILIRGIQNNSKYKIYDIISFSIIDEDFTKKLLKVVNEVKESTIQFFITGKCDKNSNEGQLIQDKINHAVNVNKIKKIQIADLCINFGKPYVVVENRGYEAIILIKELGFDQKGQPYLVVNMNSIGTSDWTNVKKIHFV